MRVEDEVLKVFEEYGNSIEHMRSISAVKMYQSMVDLVEKQREDAVKGYIRDEVRSQLEEVKKRFDAKG